MYDVTSENTAYHFPDLLPVIVLGVGGGILGSFYNFLLIKILRVYTLINEYLLLSYLRIYTLVIFFLSEAMVLCIVRIGPYYRSISLFSKSKQLI